MSNRTGIEWTDATSNPLRYRNPAGKAVWGCVKVSSGCTHCYAEGMAKRFGRGEPFTAVTMGKLIPYLDEKEVRHLLTSKTLTGKRVFLNDMTDMFGEWVSDELLDQMFAVMALRPDVTFQVLTKRAERMRRYFAAYGNREGLVFRAALPFCNQIGKDWDYHIRKDRRPDWPLPNVWLGVSVEDQKAADSRIPELLKTPAAVRFLSCEPLLGSVTLREIQHNGEVEIDALTGDHGVIRPLQGRSVNRIDWVIVGGESGAGARPMHPDWARSIRDQCQEAGVAFYFKQWGHWLDFEEARRRKILTKSGGCFISEWHFVNGLLRAGHQNMEPVGKAKAGRLLDGREWSEFPAVPASV